MGTSLQHRRYFAVRIGIAAAEVAATGVNWKRALFRFLGKDPDPIVVSFLSGPQPLALKMLAEVRRLVPDREHWAVTELDIPGVVCVPPSAVPGALLKKRIGLAPVLFAGGGEWGWMRWQAFRVAPRKLLAYNTKLERHHLRLRTLIASFLFWRGVPLDRIWLRPSWLVPWKKDRTVPIASHVSIPGRGTVPGRPPVGVLTPYLPFPLSHGGAVRIYNLLREAAVDFDIYLFAFSEKPSSVEGSPLLDICAEVVLFPQPRYREPRWASIHPPEVLEFQSVYVQQVLADYRRQHQIALLQIEYTQLATYSGDVLVEHDVTFDLYNQIHTQNPTLSSRWNAWRWRRFEELAVQRFARIVAMSEKDAGLLNTPGVRVLPNGVDLRRFRPEPEQPGSELLFVGSFRHFPNVSAFQWFMKAVWPALRARIPSVSLKVIAGPNPELYWSDPDPQPGVEVHGFVSDVRPFYRNANIALVPTLVSAGTNLKVIEAIAMERAVVSTTSGCAGLGLVHGESIWVADLAVDFLEAIERLLLDDQLRKSLATKAATQISRFDWQRVGMEQKRIWTELLAGVTIRQGQLDDLPFLQSIQSVCHSASQWEPATYFEFDVAVAELGGNIAGFVVSRDVVGEIEVLNLAVAPEFRRKGVAKCLLNALPPHDVFLEVRESNSIAIQLYRSLGYIVVGRREEYYENPVETALVMRCARRNPAR